MEREMDCYKIDLWNFKKISMKKSCNNLWKFSCS